MKPDKVLCFMFVLTFYSLERAHNTITGSLKTEKLMKRYSFGHVIWLPNPWIWGKGDIRENLLILGGGAGEGLWLIR